jgi:hypothetical protein
MLSNLRVPLYVPSGYDLGFLNSEGPIPSGSVYRGQYQSEASMEPSLQNVIKVRRWSLVEGPRTA